MSLLLPIALMAMQVGIDPRTGSVPGVPPELRDRPPRGAAPAARAREPVSLPPRLIACLEGVKAAPASAVEDAEAWLVSARGGERAQAGHCLGVAQAETGAWTAAAASFAAARDAVPAGNHIYRARLGTLAGNAALAAGDGDRALVLLEGARTDAGDTAALRADVEIIRARALVSLDRPADARLALGEARAARPEDGEAWLLSATLSRRENDLVTAQSQIERAAALSPRDPAIGLEAGVIAALAGQHTAARRSFESVIALAPDSDEAIVARAYLAQLTP